MPKYSGDTTRRPPSILRPVCERRPRGGAIRSGQIAAIARPRVGHRLHHRLAFRLVDDLDEDRVGGPEAGIDGGRGERAAQEHGRADQQQRGRGDLQSDQDAPRSAGPRILDRSRPQRAHRIDARGLQRRHQSEQRGRDHRAERPGTAATRQSPPGIARMTSPMSAGMLASPRRRSLERDAGDEKAGRRGSESNRLSVSNCRTMRRARRAERQPDADLPLPRTPRASSRFATFAQPIIRIRPNAKNSGVKTITASRG